MCKSISFYENNIVNLSLRLSFLRDFTEFLAFLLGFPAFRLAVHSPPIRLFAFFYFYFYWVFPEFRLEVRSLLIHPFTFFYFSFYWASLYRRVLGFSSSWRPSGGPHLLFFIDGLLILFDLPFIAAIVRTRGGGTCVWSAVPFFLVHWYAYRRRKKNTQNIFFLRKSVLFVGWWLPFSPFLLESATP